jgi:hypothetical protein
MLPNGDMLVVSGQKDVASGMNSMPQVWQAGTGTWRNLTNALLVMPFYPYMLVAPNGKVFYAGPEKTTRYLDTSGTGAWTTVASSRFGTRNWGTAVMYEPGKVLLVGGAQTAFYGTASGGQLPTATAEVIDLNAGTPSWRYVASMTQRRKHLNTTILPDGRVLVTGGSSGSEGTNEMSADPAYESEVWDPATESWTTWASLSIYRGYHAIALLLPDGRILSASGDYGGPSYEVFSPPYLFKGARPAITSAPSTVNQAQTFFVQTPDAASITKATIISISSVTHGFNMSQRFNKLTFSQASGGLNINVPSNPNTCPPGYYMLFLLNGNGVPSVGKIIRITTPTTPNAPSNLTASAASSGVINLFWTDNSSNEEGFKIERCQGSTCTNYAQIAQVGIGVTTYANTGLTASTTYRYRVRAYSGSLNSSYSSVASATTSAPPPAGSGTGLKGDYYNNSDLTSLKLTRTDATVNFNWGTGSPNSAISSDTFSVRWTGQVQPLFSETYTFYTVSDDGVRLWVNGTLLINNWTNHSSVENSGAISLAGNQKYDIVMEYYENTNGATATLSWSSASQAKQIIPKTQLYAVVAAPSAPSSLVTTQVASGNINLAWTDNSNNESGFKIERCQGTSCSNFVEIAQVGSGVTTYSNTGLTSGTSYSYRVRAYNSSGNSSYSNTVTATTPTSGPTLPSAPSSLSATPASSSQVNLAWTDNANDESGFRIERSADAVSFAEIATVGANVTSYANSGLSATTYYYRIRSYNAAGNSAYSNTASASPGVSYGLSASPTTVSPGSAITVSWSAPVSHSVTDWVGLFIVGAADTNFIAWQYIGAAASGTITFTSPSQSGQYELRYFLNDGFTRAAISNQVTVPVPNSPFTVTASPSTVARGSTISVNWSAPTSHSATDWVGLYLVGAPNTTFVLWQYTTTATSGTMTFTAPTQPGQYEFRYLLNDGFTGAASSNFITIP